jgi:hypothetical protein
MEHRVKRVLLLAAVAAAVAVAVGVSSVRAAPIPGARHVSGTQSYTDYLFVGGLTSLGCPFVLHDYGDNATGTLSATYHGWIGPFDENTNTAQFLLRAHVTGTVQDVAGNSYAVSGNFTDSSTHVDPFGDLVFDGPGHVSVSGPTGSVVGRADFRFVEGPPEFSLTFSSIQSCTI